MLARHMARDLADDALDLVRQRAAIGVAEHDPARAGLVGGPGAGQRIVGIGLVAVEEMLAVEHRLAARARRPRATLSRIALEVLLQRAAERDVDVVVPALATKQIASASASSRAARPGSLAAERPARLVMPKAVKRAALRALRSKKSVSSGLAPGIAALDIVDAEPVEQRRRSGACRPARSRRRSSARRRAGWCRRGRGVRGSCGGVLARSQVRCWRAIAPQRMPSRARSPASKRSAVSLASRGGA